MDQDFDSLGLSAFLAVCITKNFTRAASMLHITQPALSQRIRRFEESIGTPLIYRSQPNLSLTSAGQEILSYGRRKKVLLDELRLKLKASEKASTFAGILRIGAFSSILRSIIMPSLGEFMRQHRELTVEYFSKEVFELPEMLMRGAIDIAILNYELADPKIEKVHLFEESYVLVESDCYDASDVYLDHDPYDQTTINFLHNAGMSLSIERSYCDDIYGIIDGVRLGMGRAVVPQHLVREQSKLRVMNDCRPLKSPVIAHVHHQEFDGLFHQRIVAELKHNCVKVLHSYEN